MSPSSTILKAAGQEKQKQITLDQEKLKVEKLQASMKYLQKYERQGNLMTYYFDFVIPYINNIQ